jgi:hypothetical protein
LCVADRKIYDFFVPVKLSRERHIAERAHAFGHREIQAEMKTMEFFALSLVSHTLSSNWNFAYFCLSCGDGEHETSVIVLLWKRMRHARISPCIFRGFKRKMKHHLHHLKLHLHSDEEENHCLFSNLICIFGNRLSFQRCFQPASTTL